MPVTENQKTYTEAAPSPVTAVRATSDARLSAVVQAAYILEARTR
jgi:hypothetical protein